MSSVVGSLVVNLSARTAELTNGLKQAGSRVSAFATNVTSQVSTIRKGINSSGFKWAAFGISAATVAGLKYAVSEGQEAIRTENKLNAVLAATGNAAGFTSGQLQNLASDLQNVTNYEDDVTLSAMTILAAFRDIKGDVFKDAIESAMDLATVMETDLPTAATQLGKALNNPAEMGRLGKFLKPGEQANVEKLAKSGDTAGAQRAMLDAFKSDMGGAARAAADPLKQLGNTFQNIAEEIGKGALPYLIQFGEALKEQAKSTMDSIDASGGWMEVFGTVADVGWVFAAVIKGVTGTLQLLAGAVLEVAAVFGSKSVRDMAIEMNRAGRSKLESAHQMLLNPYTEWPSEKARRREEARKNKPAGKVTLPAEENFLSKDLEMLVGKFKSVSPLEEFMKTIQQLNGARQLGAFGEGADAMTGFTQAMKNAATQILNLPNLKSPMETYRETLQAAAAAAQAGVPLDMGRALFAASDAAGIASKSDQWAMKKGDLAELFQGGAFGQGNDAMQAYADALREARNGIFGLPDLRNPMEQFRDSSVRYAQMLQDGIIGQVEYDRLMNQAAGAVVKESRFAGGGEFGSKGAYDVIHSPNKGQEQKELVASAKKQIEQNTERKNLLTEIATKLTPPQIAGALP